MGPCVVGSGFEYVTMDVTWVMTVVGTSVDDAGTKDVEGSCVMTDVDGARVVVVEAKFDVAVAEAMSLVVVVGMDVEAVVVEVNSAAVVVVTAQLLGPHEVSIGQR